MEINFSNNLNAGFIFTNSPENNWFLGIQEGPRKHQLQICRALQDRILTLHQSQFEYRLLYLQMKIHVGWYYIRR